MTTWLAAFMLVAAVALFVAAPLTEGFFRRRGRSTDELALEHLEHDRQLAMQGLRELEFDHAMGKVDEADYANLCATLERRALAAMSALERARRDEHGVTLRLASRRARPTASPPSPAAPRVAPTQRIKFCPQCGAAVGAGYNFCAECGTSLAVGARAVTQGE